MSSTVLLTQIKREFWENKVSFIYTPVIITLLMIIMASAAGLYANNAIDGKDVHFHLTAADGVTFSNENASSTENVSGQDAQAKPEGAEKPQQFHMVSSVQKDPKAFNSMVLAALYANTAMLYLVFFIVLGAYALRCLFDDRKNKDILFWRSMPVSENTNVLVKLAMLLLAAPIIMLVLNVIVTLLAFLVGLVILSAQGVPLMYLVASVLDGGALYRPFWITYEAVLLLFMLVPFIGFALFSSAFARKTPFFIFNSPGILMLADKILNVMFGINIGINDALLTYWTVLVAVKSSFDSTVSFVWTSSALSVVLISLAIGIGFVISAIWLRNNRYEI